MQYPYALELHLYPQYRVRYPGTWYRCCSCAVQVEVYLICTRVPGTRYLTSIPGTRTVSGTRYYSNFLSYCTRTSGFCFIHFTDCAIYGTNDYEDSFNTFHASCIVVSTLNPAVVWIKHTYYVLHIRDVVIGKSPKPRILFFRLANRRVISDCVLVIRPSNSLCPSTSHHMIRRTSSQ